ncbi:hypothetical protein BDP55DRAFT_687689 [Colletotrichum godetiae]|uniref:Uncharacterized protein n=1 Tax=Colletotrichum godetiae TaxID=1209918 RepID=A0AAJ0ELY7_9PEZI|nr:uncharacterized protein BDP55DRAFT_687689 [Colletotrichum godetiae]KAK1656866.1 hypothetical protein BDP55DRAFT_687689 [Colletotrichum godetiae]
MGAAVIGNSMNTYARLEEDGYLSPAGFGSKAHCQCTSLFAPSFLTKKAAMNHRNATILQLRNDASMVLASFDRSIQDHIQRLTVLDSLSVRNPELSVSDDGVLGFAFLRGVERATEHLRNQIAAWASWLHNSAASNHAQTDTQLSTLHDLRSRTQLDKQKASVLSSNEVHDLPANQESETTLFLPTHPTDHGGHDLSSWYFPAVQRYDTPSLGRLDISPSYDQLDASPMSHPIPDMGLLPSVEPMQDDAISLCGDRDVHGPRVECTPDDTELFVQSSIEASPIPDAQSPAKFTIGVRSDKPTGQPAEATISFNDKGNVESGAKLDTQSLGPGSNIRPGLAGHIESADILFHESNLEAVHDDENAENHSCKNYDRHSEPIDKLIDIAVEYVDAKKLFCQSKAHFRQRLSQFFPATFVDDTLFLQLLRMITEDSRFVVIDPLHSRLHEAFPHHVVEAFSMDFDGLVLPINVNVSNQMLNADRNHWVIAIINPSTRTFDAFGMQEDSFLYWGARVDVLASELLGRSVELNKRSRQLGPYTHDSCCAFLCSYALDCYLGAGSQREGKWPTGPELRESYFRRLLIHWGVPSGSLPVLTQLTDFDALDSPQSIAASSHLDSSKQVPCTGGRHHCLFSDLQEFYNSSGCNLGQLTDALIDTESALKIEHKARLVQMIMECRPLPEDEHSSAQLSSGSCSLKELFHEINEMKSLFQLHSFQHRSLLIETAKEFEVQLERVREKQRNKRSLAKARWKKQSKEASSQQPSKVSKKKKLQREPETLVQQGQHERGSRETAESKVIRRATGIITDKPMDTPYYKYVKEGRILQNLERDIGCGILRCLPGAVIRPDETVLRFRNARKCFNLLRQNIDPIQYNNLNHDGIAFFKRWFRALHPELGPFT